MRNYRISLVYFLVLIELWHQIFIWRHKDNYIILYKRHVSSNYTGKPRF